ncbi:MAG: ATP-binding protein [Eubacteriaceae bacterium]
MSNLITKNRSDSPPIPMYNSLQNDFTTATVLIDDIVLKNYITKLTEFDIIPLEDKTLENNVSENVRLFKINEMVYHKDEYSTYKFASVFNSAQNMDCTVFIIADSDGQKTNFYMGIRSLDSKRTTKSLKDTLKNALTGQFPGIKTEDLLEDKTKTLINNFKASSIASVSCVANNKDAEFINNQTFLQGLEKVALAMQGQRYTAIVIANGASTGQLKEIRKGYENIYTQLSPFANMQLSYGSNHALSLSNAFSSGVTTGSSYAYNTSSTKGMSTSTSESKSHSLSQESGLTKGLKGTAAAVGIVGAALAPFTGGLSLAIGGVASGAIGLAAGAVQKTVSDSSSISTSTTENTSDTTGETNSTNKSTSSTDTKTEGFTSGTSNNMQLTMQNKSIIGTLERIDTQLKRLQECESLGMWECAAYFLSDNQETSEMAASTYKALMKGENSGVEMSAMNFWGKQTKDTLALKDYVTNFIHPVFAYSMGNRTIPVTPSAFVSGNELAIHMGLPRKSVCGFPVIEHADFAKEIVRYDGDEGSKSINLGKVFNMGSESKNSVKLDRTSLTMHTFITGSTGSGKSNTIYEMLDKLRRVDVPFLVIEPVKGEYKNVFGNHLDVTVLGTNPDYSELLKINPFKFPNKIHILEHVDRLIEIFNVCWPMYAAMPAILKDAVLQSYQVCGWDLVTSKNPYSDEMFPTFADLQDEIMNVIEISAYSKELKSNYIGSLATRIKSLTNGLNGQIFCANETDNKVLFDCNVIIDLSRVGSLETKSLIMGILVMRLNEHRICFSEGMNLPLKHITVLEEAHNILKRTSNEQNPESSNMTGKSVELLANSIAEMRTYGEGFIIADQSPNAVDMSAIRNTNTKIVMRLPDEADRRLAGKAAALKDEQLDEISKLPKGVAIIYQNDWLEPVLCKIKKFDCNEKLFEYEGENSLLSLDNNRHFNTELLKLLLKGRVSDDIVVDTGVIERLLDTASISTKNKLGIRKLLNEYDLTGKLELWQTDKFGLLSELISELLNAKTRVENAIIISKDFEDLNQNLLNLINDTTDNLYEQMKIEICHAFMRQNSEGGQDRLEIFSAWKNFVENEGEVR